MSYAAHLSLFFVLVFGAVILPGLDMAFILGSTLTGGRRHGFGAVGGAIAGAACHSVIAALGAGMLLKIYPVAFKALLIVGALYIAWIGVSILRTPPPAVAAKNAAAASVFLTFRRELANNLLNPNAYFFSLAIFPQFILPDGAPIALQAFMLFIIIAATQAGVYGTLVLVSAEVRRRLFANSRAEIVVRHAVGITLILVATYTGITGWLRL
jgi:threonine/homoserine/homoserine lactone efflux protein